MKIVQLSKNEGAARAAYRLHQGLQRVGQHSAMVVEARTSDDPNVVVFERRRADRRLGQARHGDNSPGLLECPQAAAGLRRDGWRGRMALQARFREYAAADHGVELRAGALARDLRLDSAGRDGAERLVRRPAGPSVSAQPALAVKEQ